MAQRVIQVGRGGKTVHHAGGRVTRGGLDATDPNVGTEASIRRQELNQRSLVNRQYAEQSKAAAAAAKSSLAAQTQREAAMARLASDSRTGEAIAGIIKHGVAGGRAATQADIDNIRRAMGGGVAPGTAGRATRTLTQEDLAQRERQFQAAEKAYRDPARVRTGVQNVPVSRHGVYAPDEVQKIAAQYGVDFLPIDKRFDTQAQSQARRQIEMANHSARNEQVNRRNQQDASNMEQQLVGKIRALRPASVQAQAAANPELDAKYRMLEVQQAQLIMKSREAGRQSGVANSTTSALGAQGGAAQDQWEFARRTADIQESMVQSYQREPRPTVDGIATLPPGVGESVFGELYAPGQQSPQAGNMFGGGTQALLGQLPESDTARELYAPGQQSPQAGNMFGGGTQALLGQLPESDNGESGPTGPAGMRGSGEFFEGRNVTPSPSPAVIGQRLGNVSMPASQDPTAVAIAESQANIARMGRQAGQGLPGAGVFNGESGPTGPTALTSSAIPGQDGRATRPFEGPTGGFTPPTGGFTPPTGGFTLPPQSMAGPQNQITQDAVAALLGGLRARNPHSSPEEIAQLAIQQGAPPELVAVDARERALRATQLSPLQAAMKEFPLQAPGGQGGGGGILPMRGPTYAEQSARIDAEAKRALLGTEAAKSKVELTKLQEEEAIRNIAPIAGTLVQRLENIKNIIAPRGKISSILSLGGPDEQAATAYANDVAKEMAGMSPVQRKAMTGFFNQQGNPTATMLRSWLAETAKTPGGIEFGPGQEKMRAALTRILALFTDPNASTTTTTTATTKDVLETKTGRGGTLKNTGFGWAPDFNR